MARTATTYYYARTLDLPFEDTERRVRGDPNDRKYTRVILAAALLLSAGLFGVDLLLPLDMVEGIMYVPVVLLTLWLPGNRYTLWFSVSSSILIGLGFFWSPVGDSPAMILTNRFLSIVGIWLAAVVAVLYKQKQLALRESEARNKLILDTAAEGIVSFSSEGDLESINRAAERMFGYSSEEVRGQAVDLLLPHVQRTDLFESTNGIGSGVSDSSARKLRTEELLGRREDGSTFPLRISVSKVHLPTDTLYTAVVHDITDRRQLERELIGVPEEERQQIGYDLHEGVGQVLNGIKLFAESLADRLQDRDQTSAQAARRICEGLTEADRQVAELISQLTPVNLTANDLAGALDHMLETTPGTANIHCEVVTNGRHPIRNNTLITHLYHIAREAVNNAIRHGEASCLILRLDEGPDETRLEIADDGRGIEADISSVKGMGLRMMEYRARIIGATLQVESTPGKGTVVRCILPKVVAPRA